MPDPIPTRPTNLWLAFATAVFVLALWLGDRALEQRADGECLWAFGALLWLTALTVVALGAAVYIFVALFLDLPLLKTAGQKKEERAIDAEAKVHELIARLTALGAPEPPPDAFKRVDALLEQGSGFREPLLLAKKSAKRSNQFPLLFTPPALAQAVRKWNEQVLDLADACLLLAENSDVEAYPAIIPLVTPDALLTLVQANMATLQRIREVVRPREEPPARD